MIGKGTKELGMRTADQCLFGIIRMHTRKCARLIRRIIGEERRFVLSCIRAGRFTERFGIDSGIQYVIHDLECKSEMRGVTLCGERSFIRQIKPRGKAAKLGTSHDLPPLQKDPRGPSLPSRAG